MHLNKPLLLDFGDPKFDVPVDREPSETAYDELAKLKECQFTRSYAGLRAIRQAIHALEDLGEGRRYEWRRDQFSGIVVTRRSTSIGIYPQGTKK